MPVIHESIQFENPQFVSSGLHAFVYKVEAVDAQGGRLVCCLKLFKKEWTSAYDTEAAAYEYLLHNEVEFWIPDIIGTAQRNVSGWGLDNLDGDREGNYYGLLMEWIEGGERLTPENVRADHIVSFVRGLVRIHEAGVLHNDTWARNMLVVPGSNRAVWIDFGSATLDPTEEQMKQEMELGATHPITMVRPNAIRYPMF